MLISTTKILSVLHYDKNIKIPEKNAKKHEPLKNHQKDESLGGLFVPSHSRAIGKSWAKFQEREAAQKYYKTGEQLSWLTKLKISG